MSRGVAGTTALITDVERRKALPIIRSLGRAGVRVVGLSAKKFPLGQYSKYCAAIHQTADCRQQPEEFLGQLRDIARQERADVLYPLEDVSLELCVRHRDRWSDLLRALLPAPDALETAYDKWQTLKAARDCGIAIPRSWCPETPAEVADIAARGGAFIVKPRKSSGSRGLAFVDRAADLPAAWAAVAREFPRPLVQERIPAAGKGVGAFFLLDEGRTLLARFGHRRLREYPVRGGPSTLRESFRDEALLEQSLLLVQHIGCTGVSMVEYKQDLRTGQYLLMEVNPRFWGSVALAVHAGVDFPLLYHQAALGIPFPPVLDYALGRYCRWLWPGDILHFISNPDRFRLEPSFFRFRDPDTVDDILSRDDPWPAVGIIAEAVRKVYERER